MLFDFPSAYAGPGIQAEGNGPANTAVLLMQGNPTSLQRKISVPLYTTWWFVGARKRASADRTVEEVAEFVLIPEIPVVYLANQKHKGTPRRAPVLRLPEMRKGGGLTPAEILNVDVSAEADVVGQVPAVMVWVVVEYDLVGAPDPIVAEAEVSGSHTEIETAEPEALAVATFDAPHVALADAPREAAMLPGMIKMIVGIVAAGIVAYPLIVGVNVRSFGVAGFVGIFWSLLRCRVCFRPGRSRTVSGDVPSADVLSRRTFSVFFLCESWNRTDQEQTKNS